MNYVEPLDDILNKVTKAMYNAEDVPDIDLESMSGVITSGKALKAIYWGLITRCEEKMKVWEPAIRHIVEIIINGCYVYNDIAQPYLSNETFPMELPFEVEVTRNDPIPDDEEAEKQIDMQEVQNQLMSRQSYMVKWRSLTEKQANKEIIQMAVEQSLLNDLALPLDQLSENSLMQQLQDEYGVNLDAINEDEVVEEESLETPFGDFSLEDDIVEES